MFLIGLGFRESSIAKLGWRFCFDRALVLDKVARRTLMAFTLIGLFLNKAL